MKNLSLTIILCSLLSIPLFSQIFDVDGTAKISGLSGTGLRMVTADPFGQLGTQAISGGLWSQNGANIYYNSGKVGIGIAAPSANLAVGGSGASYEAIHGETGIIGGTAVSGTATAITGISDGGIFVSNSPDGRAIYAANYAVNGYDFYAASSNSRNYFAGNVGIGTLNPLSQLSVGGDGVYFAMISGQSTNNTGVYGESTTSSGVYGYSSNSSGVYGKSPNSTGVYGESTEGSGVFGTSTNTSGVYGESTNSSGVYGYSTNNVAVSAQGGTYDFYASSSNGRSYFAGKVGIGVGVPSSLLSVGGIGYDDTAIYGQSDSTNGAGVFGVSNAISGSSSHGGRFAAVSPSGSAVYAENVAFGGYDIYAASGNSKNYFAGVLGIGTQTILSDMHIFSSTAPAGIILQGNNLNSGVICQGAGNDFSIRYISNMSTGSASSGARFNFFAGALEPYYDDGLSLGSPAAKWSEVWSYNGTIQTSDIRYKDDVRLLSYGLDEVMDIEPISFRWKESNDHSVHLGFSAQNVESIIPEIVVQPDQEKSDAGFDKQVMENMDIKGMKYAEMIPVLVKAIQEQQAIINKLDARIQELENN